MNITIISDCRDDNAAGRQMTRIASRTGITPAYVSISSEYADLEVGGNVIDMLDAQGGKPGIIIANAAPRHGVGKKWENGTPFCIFRYKETYVLSTVAGYALSLVKKLKLTDRVYQMAIPHVCDQLIAAGIIDDEHKERTIRSQFRSFDFLPFVAVYIAQGGMPDGSELSLQDVDDAPAGVWWIDNFGNAKTTFLEAEKEDLIKSLLQRGHVVRYYDRLKDVPDDAKAIITGSSGIGDQRFLEMVVQGKRGCDVFDVQAGTLL